MLNSAISWPIHSTNCKQSFCSHSFSKISFCVLIVSLQQPGTENNHLIPLGPSYQNVLSQNSFLLLLKCHIFLTLSFHFSFPFLWVLRMFPFLCVPHILIFTQDSCFFVQKHSFLVISSIFSLQQGCSKSIYLFQTSLLRSKSSCFLMYPLGYGTVT